MLDVDLENIESLLKLGLIKVNLVYPITKSSHFRLGVDLSIKLSNGNKVLIPKDFEFDGSSAPRFLWWFFPSYGDFFFAAVIHDYLYHTKYMSEDLGMDYAQKFADKEMLRWSILLNRKSFGKQIDNYMRYYAVKLFGKKQYLD